MSKKEGIDFSDEIRALQDIMGSLHILSIAGKHADEYNELFSYQMLTCDAFSRHIAELKDVIKSLESYNGKEVSA